MELEKLSKQQLLEHVQLLQAQLASSSDINDIDSLTHNLSVHQIELEMQNRELREAQLQLEETRDQYADLYDFAPMSYVTLDEKGIINNINLTGATMLGQVRSRIVGHPFSKWIIKSDVNVFFNHLRKTLASNVRNIDELKLRDASGKLCEVRIESVRTRDVINNAYFCRSILLDVTASNRAKNEVTLQARQLRLVTDALPVLISYIDEYEKHLFANKMYTDWFSVKPEEITGKSISEVWGESNYIKLSANLRISLSGMQITFDMELPLGGNQIKSVNISLIPDFDADKHVCGVITLMSDNTDRLAAEEMDRKRLLDTAHISRLSSMGEMASEIAHELNQPLAAISIYSDACKRLIQTGKGQQDKIIQSLTDINAQAERAGAVIRRIREFTSKKELSLATTDANTLVRDAVHLLAVELRSNDIKLNLNLEDALPLVYVDKILIEQVIFNLARNAIEAMNSIEQSKRVLQISTLSDGKREVEINIEDTGPGLSVEQKNEVFNAFHTTKTDGMGLGLAISKSIVDAHHGRLWAVSNAPNGSIFSFTIPIEVLEEDSGT